MCQSNLPYACAYMERNCVKMKRFEFCLIVGMALILGMCLFASVSEANWAAAATDSDSDTDRASSSEVSLSDSDSDTNDTSSSGFFSDMWETLSGWFTSPGDDKKKSKKPTLRDRAPQRNPSPSQPGRIVA